MRAEKLANETLLAKGTIPNSDGFPALPDELYSEILSHLGTMPIPQVGYLTEKTDPYRHVTLFALSQTCRSLRSFFLPYAWERIEVFGGMWTPTGKLATHKEHSKRAEYMKKLLDVKFSEEVLRQFETVTLRNPELGQYVRIVNIMFVNMSYKDIIIPELAHKLSLLPHVHTLQISSADSETDLMPISFFQYSYPQIQTLCLCGHFLNSDILPACPNVRSFIQHTTGVLFVQSLLRTCANQLEVFGVLSNFTVYQMSLEAIARGFPRLRDVAVDHLLLREYEDNLSSLSLLPLHTLRLWLPMLRDGQVPSRFSSAGSAECERWIVLAKKVLTKCPSHGTDVRKRVVVVKDGKSVEIHPVFA